MSAPPLPTEYNTTEAVYYTDTGQNGFFDTDTGVWIPGAAPFGYLRLEQAGVPSGVSYVGLQFQLYDLDAISGLPINPPIFPEPRPYDFVTGTAAESEPFTLNLWEREAEVSGNGAVAAYLVPEVAPVEYSTAIPPFSRNELTAPLGVVAHVGGDLTSQDIALPFSVLQPYIQHPNFRGRISISLQWVLSTAPFFIQSYQGFGTQRSPSLTIRQTPFHTGMMVSEAELQRRARAVHSYKSGFPYLSDKAVPDGYTDGIMMHPDDYDPIDPVAQGTGEYVPSPREGVVDDEVTDLEG